LDKGGIRIGFLAYTQFLNLRGAWEGRIALFDAAQARHDVEELRPRVDVLVVSYHAGAEYTDKPSQKLQDEFRMLADAGADIVVGHHPHYIQGIEMYKGKLIFYSLGNFVFYQPQLALTRFGLGVEFTLKKRGSAVHVEQVRLLPVRAGLQPSLVAGGIEERSFFERLRKLSSAQMYESSGAWFMKIHQEND
jgi:poly-gamma-glutamate synthesis protein (capsule biosynthesis protein)